ncbi:hypothetical protein GCM10008956_39870 [Deinococcus arenae]|uniref:Uncharacterized protein n=1 Tax=Deinococcus arenae TaxID=1452751 RepID=A0A8H9GSN7_9DEIO|nr:MULTISPECIES: hypothetical protein [Deinococcus]GGM60271.1 hypothetical protein GCM10008956_39870 [Deinococcus arenae]
MKVQFAEGDADLMQSNLFPLSFEFVVQQPIPSGRVVQGDLPGCLLYFIPLLTGTARLRAVLMIP